MRRREGEALRDATHALVLLDLGLPPMDLFDLAGLRRRGDRAALLVLNARGAAADVDQIDLTIICRVQIDDESAGRGVARSRR